MNPSPTAVEAIRARVTDWSPDDAAIVTALNTPSIDNPVAQIQLPVVLSEYMLATQLTDPNNASGAKIINWSNYGLLQRDILANDHERVKGWAEKLAMAGLITPSEETAIVAAVDATILDPAWQAQISWAQATIGREVDANDIAVARPGV